MLFYGTLYATISGRKKPHFCYRLARVNFCRFHSLDWDCDAFGIGFFWRHTGNQSKLGQSDVTDDPDSNCFWRDNDGDFRQLVFLEGCIHYVNVP